MVKTTCQQIDCYHSLNKKLYMDALQIFKVLKYLDLEHMMIDTGHGYINRFGLLNQCKKRNTVMFS